MDKKPESETVRINLGRLEANAKFPEIPHGATVSVKVVERPNWREAMATVEFGPETLGGLHDVLIDGKLVGKMQAMHDGAGYMYRRGPAGGVIVNYTLLAESIPHLKSMILADQASH